MTRLIFNPEFKVDGHECSKCNVPLMTREDAVEFRCEYIGNMLRAEKAAGALLTETESVVLAEIDAVPVFGPMIEKHIESPFSEPGSPEREDLKAKVDGPWGSGARELQDADPEAAMVKATHNVGPTFAQAPGGGMFIQVPLDGEGIAAAGSDPDDLRKLLGNIFETVAPKKNPDAAKREAAEHSNRLLDELIAFAQAKNPEEHMRNRMLQSLKEVKFLIERTRMMVTSFGWENVAVELSNVDVYLGHAIRAAEAVTPREELTKR